MFTIKNVLRQPLVINVPDEPTIYLLDKEVREEITETQLDAPEMKNHIELGNIIILQGE